MSTTVETVKVVVAGEASGAKKALSDTEQAAGTAASKVKAHFANIFSGLSSNEALAPIMSQFQELSGLFSGMSAEAKGLGDKISNVGVATAGLGGGLVMIGDKDKAATQQLAQSFVNVGSNIDDYKGRIDKTVSSLAKYGDTSPQVEGALQRLVQATRNPKTALDDMGVAANLAAARHESLGEAASQLAQVIGGKGSKTLAAFGITLSKTSVNAASLTRAQAGVTTASDKLSAAQLHLTQLEEVDHTKKKLTIQDHIALQNAQNKVTQAEAGLTAAHAKVTATQAALTGATGKGQAAVNQLAQLVKGDASAASQTFTGHLQALRAEIENHVAEIGQEYGPAIAGAGAGLAVLGQAANGAKSIIGIFSKTTETAAAGVEALSGAEEASSGASDAMAAGEVAVEAAGAPIWVTVGLIVLGIAALIAIVYELVTHWKTVFATMKAVVEDVWKFIDNDFIQPVKRAFEDVVNFIKAHWQLILAIITGPIGLAVLFIKDNFNAIVNFFTSIPSRIMSAIGSLVNIGRKIINDIVGGIAAIGWQIWNFFDGVYWDIVRAIGSLVGIGSKIVGDILGGISSVGWKIWNFFDGVWGFISRAIGDLSGIGQQIVGDIVNGIESAPGAIIGAIKSVLPHSIFGVKIPFGFAEGGVVPGALGAPMLAVVHGGEIITPPSILAGGYVPGPPLPPSSKQTINSGGNTTNVNIAAITNAQPMDIANEVTWQLGRLAS